MDDTKHTTYEVVYIYNFIEMLLTLLTHFNDP